MCKESLVTYQVRQRIQFLTHETAPLPPSRNFSVHEVEEKPKGHEGERRPYGCVRIRRTKAIPHGAENGHEATEAYGFESTANRRHCKSRTYHSSL